MAILFRKRTKVDGIVETEKGIQTQRRMKPRYKKERKNRDADAGRTRKIRRLKNQTKELCWTTTVHREKPSITLLLVSLVLLLSSLPALFSIVEITHRCYLVMFSCAIQSAKFVESSLNVYK